MEHTRLLILGATVSGIALARARGSECALVEEGMLPGSEYVAGMNMAPYRGEALGAGARALLDECRAGGLVNAAGEIHLPPIQAMLARRLKDSGARVRLYTRVLDVTPVDGGFYVTLFDAQGAHGLLAERIVDTRADGQGKKALCAALNPPKGEGLPELPGAQVLRGPIAGEYVLKLPLPDGASWPQARSLLHAYWQANAKDGWEIAAVAPNFVYDYDHPMVEQTEPGRFACISASFGDLFAAWEGGEACACTL